MSSFLALSFIGLMSSSPLALPEKAFAQPNQVDSMTDKILKDMNINPQDDSVSIGQDRAIGPDEVISENVVVVGANLTVNGKVYGDAVCIGGNLKVGPQAEIRGDMVNIGGQLSVDPSAKTNGERVNVGGFPFGLLKNLPGPGVDNSPQQDMGGVGINKSGAQTSLVSKFLRLVLDCIYLSVLLFFALIVTVFMPRQFNHIEEHLNNEFPRCTLLGIALLIGFPVILLAFVITIVGILAIPLLVLAWVLSCLLGYIAFAHILGRRIFSEQPTMLQILTGLLVLSSPLLIGDLILLSGGNFFPVIGHVFRVIGFILLISINLIGFGAVVYSLWGKRGLIRPKANMPNGDSGSSSENGDATTI